MKRVPCEDKTNGRTATSAATADASATAFVAKFTGHHRRCLSLAKHFTVDNPELKDSAAISQLCRASQEMLEQAKEARTLTEVCLALDDVYRDTVRPIITERFKDIAKLARASWLRFCDSIELACATKSEIAAAQRDFAPHAEEFQRALRAFPAISAG